MFNNLLKRHNRARAPRLGTLELDVMALMWSTRSASAREVLSHLAEHSGKTISLSTVQSTLERLVRKGALLREKSGRAYEYRAALSRQSLIGLLIDEVASEIGGGTLQPVLSGFVEFINSNDPESLHKLEHLLRDRCDTRDSDEVEHEQ